MRLQLSGALNQSFLWNYLADQWQPGKPDEGWFCVSLNRQPLVCVCTGQQSEWFLTHNMRRCFTCHCVLLLSHIYQFSFPKQAYHNWPPAITLFTQNETRETTESIGHMQKRRFYCNLCEENIKTQYMYIYTVMYIFDILLLYQYCCCIYIFYIYCDLLCYYLSPVTILEFAMLY